MTNQQSLVEEKKFFYQARITDRYEGPRWIPEDYVRASTPENAREFARVMIDQDYGENDWFELLQLELTRVEPL